MVDNWEYFPEKRPNGIIGFHYQQNPYSSPWLESSVLSKIDLIVVSMNIWKVTVI